MQLESIPTLPAMLWGLREPSVLSSWGRIAHALLAPFFILVREALILLLSQDLYSFRQTTNFLQPPIHILLVEHIALITMALLFLDCLLFGMEFHQELQSASSLLKEEVLSSSA